jgi:acyl-CoA reductase-like NAD-dependent aldehyde dehydrogenase
MSTTFHASDPRTGAAGPAFTEASVSDVHGAVAAARAALTDPGFADPATRAEGMRRAAAQLRDDGDAIVATAEAETGLPQVPRLRGELERTCVQLELLAAACADGEFVDAIIDPADPEARPVPRPDLRRFSIPVGVVVVFGASNFPLAFGAAGGDTASALAAGCPVIVKGHPLHPGTGELVARAVGAGFAQAGLPDGAFQHLQSSGTEVGLALVDHPDVAAVAFTGSLRGGRALMDRAAARPTPIPVFAEMGSLNPVVITDAAAAARRDELADALTGSVCTVGGQLCTKPGLAFVPRGAAGDGLVAALRERFAAREPEVMLASGIAEAFVAGLQGLDGAPDAVAQPGAHAHPVALEVDIAQLESIEALREEHFGPALVVVRYGSEQELPAAIASLGGQLTATLQAQDGEHARLAPVVAALTAAAGRVLFAGVPTGVSVTWAMQHGGPYPATSDPRHTSVGQTAARRFVRPVAFQSAPAEVLPPAVQDGNPLRIVRRVDGVMLRD